MNNETETHYDLLSEDGNDPVLDPPEPREYLLYSTVFLKKEPPGFPSAVSVLFGDIRY